MNDDNDMNGVIQQNKKNIIPRLNGEMLHNGNFDGCEISIVGKYLGQNKNNTTLHEFEAADQTKFVVKLNINKPWNGYNTTYVEIRGYVNTDGSISQISYQEFGDSFAMSMWNKFVTLSHQYQSIF